MGKLSSEISPAISKERQSINRLAARAFSSAGAEGSAQQELLLTVLTTTLERRDHLLNGYALQAHVAEVAFAAGQQESPHQTDFLLTYAKAFPTLAARTPAASLERAATVLAALETLPVPTVRAYCTAMAQSAHGWLKADRLHTNGSAKAVPDAALSFYADLLSAPRVRALKQDDGLRHALKELTSHIHGFSEERKDQLRAVVAPVAAPVPPRAAHPLAPAEAFENVAPAMGGGAVPASPKPAFQVVQGGRRGPETAKGLKPARYLGRGMEDALAAFRF